MAEMFTNQLNDNIDVITKMNNRGYSLTGSIDGDRKTISNIQNIKREYITSGQYDRTDAYIDSRTRHTNFLDNIVDSVVGHGNAKAFDKKIESGIEYVTDTYNNVSVMPRYFMYGAIGLLILYMLKK